MKVRRGGEGEDEVCGSRTGLVFVRLGGIANMVVCRMAESCWSLFVRCVMLTRTRDDHDVSIDRVYGSKPGGMIGSFQ